MVGIVWTQTCPPGYHWLKGCTENLVFPSQYKKWSIPLKRLNLPSPEVWIQQVQGKAKY